MPGIKKALKVSYFHHPVINYYSLFQYFPLVSSEKTPFNAKNHGDSLSHLVDLTFSIN